MHRKTRPPPVYRPPCNECGNLREPDKGCERCAKMHTLLEHITDPETTAQEFMDWIGDIIDQRISKAMEPYDLRFKRDY